MLIANFVRIVNNTITGKPPGLVVNVKNSQSEPWAFGHEFNYRVRLKTRWIRPLNGRKE
jgi:hypothetical protein